MPAYGSRPFMISLAPGDVGVAFNAEQPAVGQNGPVSASVPFSLKESPAGGPRPMQVDGFFSGVPGAFEIDIQTAENDVDSQYTQVASGNITAVDGNNNFHGEFPNVIGKFVRAYVKSRANAVNVTLFFKR